MSKPESPEFAESFNQRMPELIGETRKLAETMIDRYPDELCDLADGSQMLVLSSPENRRTISLRDRPIFNQDNTIEILLAARDKDDWAVHRCLIEIQANRTLGLNQSAYRDLFDCPGETFEKRLDRFGEEIAAGVPVPTERALNIITNDIRVGLHRDLPLE
jgi:hypothetical protein